MSDNNLKINFPIPPGVSADVRQWMTEMNRALNMLQRSQGSILDSAVRVRDLKNLGILGVQGDRLFNGQPPKKPAMVKQIDPASGWTGIFAVLDTSTARVIHISVQSGVITNFSGRFECVNSSSYVTETITVASGLCTPTSGSYEVIDPHNDSTTRMSIVNGRIVAFV